MADQVRANRMATLEGWRIMAFSLGGPLGNVLSRSFDLITTVVRDGTADESSIGYSLESLKNERELAVRRDGQRYEPLRNMLYGISESVATLVESIMEERRGGPLQPLQQPMLQLQLPAAAKPLQQDQHEDTTDDSFDSGLPTPTLRTIKTEPGGREPSPDIVCLDDEACSSRKTVAQPTKQTETQPSHPPPPKTIPTLKIRRNRPHSTQPTHPQPTKTIPTLKIRRISAIRPNHSTQPSHPQPTNTIPTLKIRRISAAEKANTSRNAAKRDKPTKTIPVVTTRETSSGDVLSTSQIDTSKKRNEPTEPDKIPPVVKSSSSSSSSCSSSDGAVQNDPAERHEPVPSQAAPHAKVKKSASDETPTARQKTPVRKEPSQPPAVSHNPASIVLPGKNSSPAQPQTAPGPAMNGTVIDADTTVIRVTAFEQQPALSHSSDKPSVTSRKTSVASQPSQTHSAPVISKSSTTEREGSASRKTPSRQKSAQPPSIPPLVVKRARLDDPAALISSNRWRRSCVASEEGFYNEEDEEGPIFGIAGPAARLGDAVADVAAPIALYGCNGCARTFESKQGLKRHAFTHIAIHCPICRKYVAKEKLNQHIAEKHDRYSAEL